MKKLVSLSLVVCLMLLAMPGISALAEEAPVKLKVLIVENGLAVDMAPRPFVEEICKRANVEIEWEEVRTGWEERKPWCWPAATCPISSSMR